MNIKYIRIIIISVILLGFTIIVSQVFFLVTNSNLYNIIPIGQAQLGFEEGVIDSLLWEHTGDSSWEISNDENYSGTYSIRSGEISHEQNSSIHITVNIFEDGYMDFFYLVESEYSTSGDYFYDGLKFFIDGELIDQYQPETDGDSDWEYINIAVEEGVHTFSWMYMKDTLDGDTAEEDFCDCAWLDDISFPPCELSEFYSLAADPQDMSSGLFSGLVHPLNNQYGKMKAKGGTFADFDLDGDLDLYYGYVEGHYFENRNGVFEEITEEMEINDAGSRGIIVGDVDNNGYPDILKWRYYFSTLQSHKLLFNQGNHNFNMVHYLTSDQMINLHSQGFIDVDLDGDLDIVAVEKEGDAQFHCYLLQGLDPLGAPIYDHVFSYYRDDDESSSRTLAIADVDNDGDQDVYVPRKNDINWLFINQTLTRVGDDIVYNENPAPLFVERAIDLGVDDQMIELTGSTGYGAAWGDYDNDMDMDLYLSNWGKNRLYQNDNDYFTNLAEDLLLESDSLSNGAAWGDFNNDGLLDIWAANFKREDDVFINSGDDGYWDNSSRPIFMSATQDVIPGDYNNDGWLDVFTPGLQMAFGHGPSAQGYKYTSLLYQNITPNSISTFNHWAIVNLEGAKSDLINNGWTDKANRSAIGARVILQLTDMNIMREIIAGKGHGSMDPLQLHFGLSHNSSIQNITVQWPSRDPQTNQPKVSMYEGPFDADQSFNIVEDLGFVGRKGDVNEDEFINVLDIVILVNEILSLDPTFEPTIFWAGDMDYSNELNVLDVIKLITFSLNQA